MSSTIQFHQSVMRSATGTACSCPWFAGTHSKEVRLVSWLTSWSDACFRIFRSKESVRSCRLCKESAWFANSSCYLNSLEAYPCSTVCRMFLRRRSWSLNCCFRSLMSCWWLFVIWLSSRSKFITFLVISRESSDLPSEEPLMVSSWLSILSMSLPCAWACKH